METEPLERIDEHASGETPEDVAILYSWANLQGAKYRDFSANRREYRAQMRHRAAEQLRLMELRAQSEAEAAAVEAEAEAAAAHAQADAATVKLAASRSVASAAPEEILREREVEELRRSSLREAAQQARRASAERLEAARRAEAAALADSIARREEREIAEAQASALRQAAQYHDSELRSKQMMAQHPSSEDLVPGRISDPYSPQILAEGAYYDGPGTPPSELEASRFRTQREYIERSTGTELPPFKMPPMFDEDRPPLRPQPEFNHGAREMREPLDVRPSRGENGSSMPLGQWPRLEQHEALNDVLARDRKAAAEANEPYLEDARYRNFGADPVRPQRPEVVTRIPEAYNDAHGQDDDGRRQESDRHSEEDGPAGRLRDRSYNGSLLNQAGLNQAGLNQAGLNQAGLNQAGETRTKPGMRLTGWSDREDRFQYPAYAEERQPRHGELPPPVRDGQRTQAQPQEAHRRAQSERPQLYSATPRPSGSWLRQISAHEPEANHRRESTIPQAALQEKPTERRSFRPSVEATYNDGQPGDSLTQSDDQRPSGFRPPWLTQAQAPRQSGARHAPEEPVEETPKPRWLSPEPVAPGPVAPGPVRPAPVAGAHPGALSGAQSSAQSSPIVQPVNRYSAGADNTLQASQEKVASRWFALKGVFERTNVTEPVGGQSPKEQSSTPIVAVYSLAGGVGKTSLVATLGRALSSLGEKVLLTDTTSHGLLPFYFGANQLTSGVVRTFSPPEGSTDAPVHMLSYDLDQRGSNSQSQAALVDDLLSSSRQVNRVLMDLNGDCGWLVERIARLKPTILVPVTADMNSVVSLQVVEGKFGAMQSANGEPLRPVYLLNQFDASQPLHLDLREVLRQQLGERLLPFVIRRDAGISEALAEGMTIVDYDPDSSATQDFMGLANWIRAVSASAPMSAASGLRNLRWSER